MKTIRAAVESSVHGTRRIEVVSRVAFVFGTFSTNQNAAGMQVVRSALTKAPS